MSANTTSSLLPYLDQLIADMCQIQIPFSNYITGESAFIHKAGIHAKAVLADPTTYEVYCTPTDFGLQRHVAIGHRLTGWNAVRDRAVQLGLQLETVQLKAITQEIKQRADVAPLTTDQIDALTDGGCPIMAGFTFAEKALARAAKLDEVCAGDIVDAFPDVMLSHDNSAAIKRIFNNIGATNVLHPEKLVITLDHAVPAPTSKHAQNHAEIRQWVRNQGIANFFEVGRGICHQVIAENALVLPGETILGADSHTTHHGWVGAFGAGIGRTEMAALWATGKLWMRVPETTQIQLDGALQPGVTAKDISLRILADHTASGGIYQSIEFTGSALSTLSIDDRTVLPNMMAEFGAKNATCRRMMWC